MPSTSYVRERERLERCAIEPSPPLELDDEQALGAVRDQPYDQAPIGALDAQRPRHRGQAVPTGEGGLLLPHPALQGFGETIAGARRGPHVLGHPGQRAGGRGQYPTGPAERDDLNVQRLQRPPGRPRAPGEIGHGCGVAVRLLHMRADDVDDQLLPLGELRPAAVHRDPDRQWRPRRDPKPHLVLDADPVEELVVDAETMELCPGEEVRNLDRLAAPVPPVVREDGALQQVPLQGLVPAGESQIRAVRDGEDAAAPEIHLVVGGDLRRTSRGSAARACFTKPSRSRRA
ncbi:MAG: hypothetical protein HY002_13535 [Candidatus Rokubacteria bacterium]|nr:hypothetical protein [Candidatus Rokubacteria bacterium]